MNLNIHIKNIGKIEDARIRFGQFTVFAGPNNTAKSFVSKFLYSVYAAMNMNSDKNLFEYMALRLREEMNHIREKISILRGEVPDEIAKAVAITDSKRKLYESLQYLKKIGRLSESFTIDGIDKNSSAIANFITKVKEIQNLVEGISWEDLSSYDHSKGDVSERVHAYISHLETELQNFYSALSGHQGNEYSTDVMKFIASDSEIDYKISNNLLRNFQIGSIADLQRTKDTQSVVDIEGFGKLQFEDNHIYLTINASSIQELQRYSRVLYLESPIYGRLKSALEDIRTSRLSSLGEKIRLTGVPGYFYDLSDALRFKYSGEMDFPDIYEKLIGKEVLGGKIALSDNGDLLFNENGRSFPLSMTASGVANLGMIALLIERKVLDKNTILFIDEPETNLHPAWQVVMAEVLFELAKRGVHVVLATHSAEILKWLEVHIKRNPEDEKLVALNKFPVKNGDADQQDFDYKIADIKEELTKPFADLYIAGL